jgi:hypothetical protein
MAQDHLSLDELVRISDLPEARRRHLSGCARCRALVARYQAFLDEPAGIAPGDVRDAERRLGEFLASRLGPRAPEAPARRDPAGAARPGRGWVNLALALGVIVVAAGAVLFAIDRRPLDGRPSGQLRGASPQPGVVRLAPETADGAVTLRWRAVAGADRYQVRFFTGDLRDLGGLAAVPETLLVLRHGVLPAPAGDTVLWRVHASRGDSSLGQSDLGTVRIP